jgi:hypothetical protein
VVIGVPFDAKEKVFVPARYIARVPDKAQGKDWHAPDWIVVYRETPNTSEMPKEMGDVGPHTFGPEVLLTGANFWTKAFLTGGGAYLISRACLSAGTHLSYSL